MTTHLQPPSLKECPVVVLESPDADTDFAGQGYSGIMAPHPPCGIVVTSDGRAGCGQAVRKLVRYLKDSIRELAIDADNLRTVSWRDPRGASALEELLPPESIRVLVIVGNRSSPKLCESSDLGRLCKDWVESANSYVLPVAQEGTDIEKWLPHFVSKLNASFWHQNDFSEVVADILYVAGLDPCQRVFISYKRDESSALAMQLFDALSRERCAVFLDRFSVPKARDFQEILTEELADKALVLILESPEITKSQWVQYEMDFAKINKIGMLAIKPPNLATKCQVDGIKDPSRIALRNCEFANSMLTKQRLQRIIRRVTRETRIAYLRRLFELKSGLIFGLDGERDLEAKHDSSGIVLARKSGNHLWYGLWATPVLPKSLDFYNASQSVLTWVQCRGHRCIVSPAQDYATKGKRTVAQWLSRVSRVSLYNPSQIHDLATKIRGGQVL